MLLVVDAKCEQSVDWGSNVAFLSRFSHISLIGNLIPKHHILPLRLETSLSYMIESYKLWRHNFILTIQAHPPYKLCKTTFLVIPTKPKSDSSWVQIGHINISLSRSSWFHFLQFKTNKTNPKHISKYHLKQKIKEPIYPVATSWRDKATSWRSCDIRGSIKIESRQQWSNNVKGFRPRAILNLKIKHASNISK